MKTAIYLRQSLDRDENKLAIDRQREACLDLCKRKGWTDTVEYADNDTSASTGRRPEYTQMLADIEAGAVGAVVCYRLDRLHRQPRELEQFIDLADRHRTALATVTGDTDLSTDQGRLMARVIGAFDRAEVEKKSARQKSANKQRAKAGKAWVKRTFGYDGDVIVKREADAIRKASQALLNGAKLYGIAQEWNAEGLRTAKGYTWTGGTVRQVLIRARNAGLQTYEGEILEGVTPSWPAIVERDVWEAVCALLADPKRHTGRSTGRKHLLSGIAICGVCDKPMSTTVRKTKGRGNRNVYQCKRMGCMKIVRDLVQTDEVVVGAVTERLAKSDAATLAKATVDSAAVTDKISTLRAQIAEAEAEYDDGIIDGRRLAGRVERVTEKLRPLEEKLLGANASRLLDGLAGNPNAADVFEGLPLDRRRAVIDWLAVVTIHRQQQGGRFDREAVTVDFS